MDDALYQVFEDSGLNLAHVFGRIDNQNLLLTDVDDGAKELNYNSLIKDFGLVDKTIGDFGNMTFAQVRIANKKYINNVPLDMYKSIAEFYLGEKTVEEACAKSTTYAKKISLLKWYQTGFHIFSFPNDVVICFRETLINIKEIVEIKFFLNESGLLDPNEGVFLNFHDQNKQLLEIDEPCLFGILRYMKKHEEVI